MTCENPTPIKLHFRDWPLLVDGDPITLEQQGALITLVFSLWANQSEMSAEAAARVVGVRDARSARRLKISRLLEIAEALTRQRAPIDNQTRLHLLRKQDGKCRYCNCGLGNGFHIDHAIPVARGGKSKLSNYRAACADCNIKKGVLTEVEFLALKAGAL